MSVNRFARRQVYDQFNPLSIQELSMVPLVKQQQHDAQMAAALQQKAAANALLKDQADADKLIADVDNRINTYTGDLMNKGVQRNSTKNLLELKQYRDQLMSPQGDLGKINANAAAYQAYKETQDKRLEEWYKSNGKNGISPTTYQENMHASMKAYEGYKKGSFQGFNGTSDPGITNMAVEYAKGIGKTEIESSTGWRYVENYQNSGQGVWSKGTTTSKTTPPDVERAIEAYVLGQPDVQQYMQDQAYLDDILDRHQKDELGNYVVGDNFWADPNDPNAKYEASRQKMKQEIRSKIAPGVYQAYSGQGKKYSEDIKMAAVGNNGGNGKFNANGIGLGEDRGRSLQMLNKDISTLRSEVITLKQSNKPGDKAKAAQIEYYINKATNKFVADNQDKYSKADMDLVKKMQSDLLSDRANAIRKKYENAIAPGGGFARPITNEEILTSLGYTPEQRKKMQNYNSELNTYIKEGLVTESKRFTVNTYDEKARTDLNKNVQNNLDPNNYTIPGVPPEEAAEIFKVMKNSKDFNVEAINSYGEFAKPTMTITYTNKAGTQTIEVEGNEIQNGKMPSSWGNAVDYFTEDDSDVRMKLKGETEFANISIGKGSNIAQEFGVSPYYDNIQILRGNDGTYNLTIKASNGQWFEASDLPSKSEALYTVKNYLSSPKAKQYMSEIDERIKKTEEKMSGK